MTLPDSSVIAGFVAMAGAIVALWVWMRAAHAKCEQRNDKLADEITKIRDRTEEHLLSAIAENTKSNQAVCHAVADLRARASFRTPLPDHSDQTPPDAHAETVRIVRAGLPRFAGIALLCLFLFGCGIPVRIEPDHAADGRPIPTPVALTAPAPTAPLSRFAPVDSVPVPSGFDWTALLAAGLGALGLGGAAGALPLLARLRTATRAVRDAVAYGADAERLDPANNRDLEAMRDRHLIEQSRNGTLPIIRAALGKKL